MDAQMGSATTGAKFARRGGARCSQGSSANLPNARDVTADAASRRAQQPNESLRGEWRALHGIRPARRHMIWCVRTTRSRPYRDLFPRGCFCRPPAEDAGVIVIGKTHTHEFAFAPFRS
jgi:hypothetical protein